MNEAEKLVWIHQDVTKPTNNDVLFGRGGGVNRHAGNIHFRKLVSAHEVDYRTTSRKCEKTDISARIVALIRQLDPPGRFLKNEGSGIWRDVGDEKARNKTSQALRERGPSLVSQSQRKSDTVLDSSNSKRSDHYPVYIHEGEETKRKRRESLRVRCRWNGIVWTCVDVSDGLTGSRAMKMESSLLAEDVPSPYDETRTGQTTFLKTVGLDSGTHFDSPEGSSKRFKEDLCESDEVTSIVTDDSSTNVFRRKLIYNDNEENVVAPMSSYAPNKLVRRVTDMSLCSSGSEQDLTSNNSTVSGEEFDGVHALLQLARCGF